MAPNKAWQRLAVRSAAGGRSSSPGEETAGVPVSCTEPQQPFSPLFSFLITKQLRLHSFIHTDIIISINTLRVKPSISFNIYMNSWFHFRAAMINRFIATILTIEWSFFYIKKKQIFTGCCFSNENYFSVIHTQKTN